MNTTERLRFVLWFAQEANVNTIRQGDLLNLRDDLETFLGVHEISADRQGNFEADMRNGTYARMHRGQKAVYFPFGGMRITAVLEKTGRIAAIPVTQPYPWNYEREQFLSLQQETLSFLERFIVSIEDPGDTIYRIDPFTATYAPADAKDSNVVTLIGWPKVPMRPMNPALAGLVHYDNRIYQVIVGSTEDVFFWVLQGLLTDDVGSRLKRCSECKKIFTRNRKQEYCSKQCTNKVTFRRWQKKHAILLFKKKKSMEEIWRAVRANPADVVRWIEEFTKNPKTTKAKRAVVNKTKGG
jgi:endogenous inhibitor of DNA gyrase (YacG/DUF329 family)